MAVGRYLVLARIRLELGGEDCWAAVVKGRNLIKEGGKEGREECKKHRKNPALSYIAE